MTLANSLQPVLIRLLEIPITAQETHDRFSRHRNFDVFTERLAVLGLVFFCAAY